MAAVTLAELEKLRREAELDISRRLAKLEADSGYAVEDISTRCDAAGTLSESGMYYMRSVGIEMRTPFVNRWIGTGS